MNKRTTRILQRINKEVAEKYKDKLFHEVDIHATSLEFLAHYSKPEVYKELTQKEKERVDEMQLMKDAGMFKGKETVVDEKVSAEFEKELEETIDKYIKAGVLPDPKNDKDLQKYNKKVLKQWKKKSKSQTLKKG